MRNLALLLAVLWFGATGANAQETVWPTDPSSSGGGAVDVLVGGENSIPDQTNPNSPLIICPQPNAACFYLSTETSWWAASTSDGSTATTWSPVSEQKIWEARHETGTENNLPTFSTTLCLPMMEGVEISVMETCTDEEQKYLLGTDLYVTKVVTVALDNDGSPPSHNLEKGCSYQLKTGYGADTVIGQFNDRGSSVELAQGDKWETEFGYALAQGEVLALTARDGDFCESGTTPATCDCTGTNYYLLEIWGVRR